MIDPFPDEREMLSNEHDVMVASLDAFNTITGLDTLTTLDGVRLTNSSVSIPEEAWKRE